MGRTRFIVNPASAAGRTGKHWPKVQALIQQTFAPGFEVVFTERPMHAPELCRQGILRGCDRIIAVGGDGTVNEVVNGLVEGDGLWGDHVCMGVLDMGTGGDFTKSLQVPKRWEETLGYLSQTSPQKTDVCKAEFRTVDGTPTTRWFLNILDFGIGGAVVEHINRSRKRFGGRLSFLWSILVTLRTYENKIMRYKLDDADWQEHRLNNVIIANGRYFGGGLQPAPEAQLDDGLVDVVCVGDVGRLEATLNLCKLRHGTHLQHPKVSLARAKRVQAMADEPVYIDMDGEFVGQLPVTVTVLPKVLPLLR